MQWIETFGPIVRALTPCREDIEAVYHMAAWLWRRLAGRKGDK